MFPTTGRFTNMRLLQRIIFLLFVFSYSHVFAEIGRKPDPDDICPIPTCMTSGFLGGIAQGIANGNIDVKNLSVEQLKNVDITKLASDQLKKIDMTQIGKDALSQISIGDLDTSALNDLMNDPSNTLLSLGKGGMSDLGFGDLTADGLQKIMSDPSVFAKDFGDQIFDGMGLEDLSADSLNKLVSNPSAVLDNFSSDVLNNVGLKDLSADGLQKVMNDPNILLSSLADKNGFSFGDLSQNGMQQLMNNPNLFLKDFGAEQLGKFGLGDLNSNTLNNIISDPSVTLGKFSDKVTQNLKIDGLSDSGLDQLMNNPNAFLGDLAKSELSKIGLGDLTADSINKIISDPASTLDKFGDQVVANLKIDGLNDSGLTQLMNNPNAFLGSLASSEAAKIGLGDLNQAAIDKIVNNPSATLKDMQSTALKNIKLKDLKQIPAILQGKGGDTLLENLSKAELSAIGFGDLNPTTLQKVISDPSSTLNSIGQDIKSQLGFDSVSKDVIKNKLSTLELAGLGKSALQSMKMDGLSSPAFQDVLNNPAATLDSFKQDITQKLGFNSVSKDVMKQKLATLQLSNLGKTALDSMGLGSLNSGELQKVLNDPNATLNSIGDAALGKIGLGAFSDPAALQQKLSNMNLSSLSGQALDSMSLGALNPATIQQKFASLNVNSLGKSALQSLNLGSLNPDSIQSLIKNPSAKLSAFTDQVKDMNLGGFSASGIEKIMKNPSASLDKVQEGVMSRLGLGNLSLDKLQNMSLDSLARTSLGKLNVAGLTAAARGKLSGLLTGSPLKDDRYKKAQMKNTMKYIDNSLLDMTQAPYNPIPKIDAGIQGSLPRNIMANKNTPAISLVENYPWLYMSVDPAVQKYLYRGTGGAAIYDVNSPITKKDKEADNIYADADIKVEHRTPDQQSMDKVQCRPIQNNCGGTLDAANYHVWARLQYDSCSNQYILPMALSPDVIFYEQYREHSYPWNESLCQPLSLIPVDCVRDSKGKCKKDKGESDGKMYDYRAWGYLEAAWKNTLDSDYFPNSGVSKDNHGTNPITNDNQGGKFKLLSSVEITGEDKFGIAVEKLDMNRLGGSNYKDDNSFAGTGKRTTINQLATQPFERIFDPTHPFSPRWDWSGTDRDYSQGTGKLTVYDGANLGPPGSFYGYDLAPGSDCIVRCGSVPVDILSFREDAFRECMSCRIQVNTFCFWIEYVTIMIPIPNPVWPYIPQYLYEGILGDEDPITAWNYTLTNEAPWIWDPFPSPLLFNPMLACKSSHDKKDKWPLCSTKYDHPKDNVPHMCSLCTRKSGDKNSKGGVKKCCDDLAQALAPINTLKIRNTKDNPELEPVPEGYRFSDYFTGDPMNKQLFVSIFPDKVPHMPFMRWWDTGTAAGGTSGDQNYNPDCDQGGYDVIVGVGVDGNKGGDGAKYCRYGGNGNANKYGCYTIPTPVDSLTSWSELKQYQMNSIRKYGLNCLPQYEKIYKQDGGEDGALTILMGNPSSPITKDGKTSNMQAIEWRLAWRGYLSDPDFVDQFPSFGANPAKGSGRGFTGKKASDGSFVVDAAAKSYADNAGKASYKGLSNAIVGDIIYITHDDVSPKKPDFKVMPFVAVVTGISIKGKDDDYIVIIDINNGKYPDVCGNTDYAGFGQSRTVYKKSLPTTVYESLYLAGTKPSGSDYVVNNGVGDTPLLFNSEGNCKDPKYAVCTYYDGKTGKNLWDSFRIYRPTEDERNN